MTRITGTLHEDQYTFSIIPRSRLLRIRNLSNKRCRENWNTCFVFNKFFFLNRAVYEITWKNTAESTGHRLRYDACGLHAGIPKATNSFSEYVILLFFHCNSCCTKAPHNRIMHTLPVLLYYLRTTAYVHELAFPLKISLSCLSLNFLLHATCHDR